MPLDENDPVFGYMIGQLNPSQPPLLAAFGQESEQVLREFPPLLDIPYGPHVRQTFDFWLAHASAATIAYFHAGYWQSRDKAQFRFLAPALLQAGFNFALVNYPLCPEVELDALTEAARDFVPSFRAFLASRGEDPMPLIAAGHSAGAHLAVELALTDWPARGVAANAIGAVVALSGVYDLTPLIATPLNVKLRLTEASAKAASPLFRLRPGLPPALFAVGAQETAAFQTQNKNMRVAWAAQGAFAEAMIVEGADHFSLLRELTTPGSPLLAAIVACALRVSAAG